MIFSTVCAFRVNSFLSGCGMPHFFLARHFSILKLAIFSYFWDIKKCFFSCLGILCLLLFEWMQNALFFFWSDIFLFFNSVVFHIFGIIRKWGFQLFGHFMSLLFEWMWNALLFWFHLFSFSGKYLNFSKG